MKYWLFFLLFNSKIYAQTQTASAAYFKHIDSLISVSANWPPFEIKVIPNDTSRLVLDNFKQGIALFNAYVNFVKYSYDPNGINPKKGTNNETLDSIQIAKLKKSKIFLLEAYNYNRKEKMITLALAEVGCALKDFYCFKRYKSIYQTTK